MFKKSSVVPFLLGWLVVAWILPPTKLLGGLKASKS
jgi:hypothetical protein